MYKMKHLVLLCVFITVSLGVKEDDGISLSARGAGSLEQVTKPFIQYHNVSVTSVRKNEKNVCGRCCRAYRTEEEIPSECKEKCRSDVGICIRLCDDGCNDGECDTPDDCQCPDGFILQGESCRPAYHKRCVNSYCAVPGACECFPDPVKAFKSLCVTTCEKNTTEDCCHGLGNKTESLVRRGKKKFYLPDGVKAVTVPTDCKALVRMNKRTENFSGAFFECRTGLEGESAYSFCQLASGKYTSNHYPTISTNNTHINKILHVNVSFTFVYPIGENSTGICELCFCNDYLTIGKVRIIRLCPCVQPQPTSIIILESLTLYILLLILLVLLLLIIILITYKMVYKKDKIESYKPFIFNKFH
ncbi:uncharacterized protein LOC106664228 isoform X2 [Cimex lectularius]|uniref:Uncharacterized protein n=1 Tax=Cimex lectularius TaxID=79782 RepID=A0A8I6TF09_CIMLE|nr:uncharacterized protein LOC106664228 isoform X2 [Cimex lectularius]